MHHGLQPGGRRNPATFRIVHRHRLVLADGLDPRRRLIAALAYRMMRINSFRRIIARAELRCISKALFGGNGVRVNGAAQHSSPEDEVRRRYRMSISRDSRRSSGYVFLREPRD
jgi:hypothetical protein